MLLDERSIKKKLGFSSCNSLALYNAITTWRNFDEVDLVKRNKI